ncbi:hypothetical protein FSP39_013276 [Pinctada imbricata]|uniref:Uncharacterized protein n=1 Tax=Pinctada imbricata TaxID=66713 RepID=A0AA89BVL3_PINIB|nr:hypothetical protein FSP39_013276 [Pinctada imbricata]
MIAKENVMSKIPLRTMFLPTEDDSTGDRSYSDSDEKHEDFGKHADLRDTKGRKENRHLQLLKRNDCATKEVYQNLNGNSIANCKDCSEMNESPDNLIIEQGGLRIECQEKGIKVTNSGGRRDGKAISMVVDRSVHTGAKQGIMEKPSLEGRKSRSSSEIREEKTSQNLVWFSARYNNLFKSRSMSMNNIDDINSDNTAKRRFSCLQSFKSKLKEIFSPQRIVLQSEFVMIEENGRHIGGIHASRGAACWLFYRGGSQVVLVTHEGSVLQHMKITHGIDDLTVDKHDNIYLTCPKTKTVKRINRNRVVSTIHDFLVLRVSLPMHIEHRVLL